MDYTNIHYTEEKIDHSKTKRIVSFKPFYDNQIPAHNSNGNYLLKDGKKYYSVTIYK